MENPAAQPPALRDLVDDLVEHLVEGDYAWVCSAPVRRRGPPHTRFSRPRRRAFDPLVGCSRSIGVGMDAQDHGVRWFFEAKDEQERERQREALLATRRLYADEIAFAPTR